jgi:hypothetical protein
MNSIETHALHGAAIHLACDLCQVCLEHGIHNRADYLRAIVAIAEVLQKRVGGPEEGRVTKAAPAICSQLAEIRSHDVFRANQRRILGAMSARLPECRQEIPVEFASPAIGLVKSAAQQIGATEQQMFYMMGVVLALTIVEVMAADRAT